MAENIRAAKRVARETFTAAWQTAWKLRAAVTLGPFALALVVGWFGSIPMAIVVFVVTFLLGVVALAAFRLALQVRADETEPRPYLTFKGADTKAAATVVFVNPSLGVGAATATTATTTYPVGAVPTPNDFARALIANDPPVGKKSQTAQQVTGRIEFYDENEDLVLTMQGRWAETLQRGQRPQLNITLDTVQLDIAANGLDHPLDVAMKRPNDAHFYAFNDDNSHSPDLCLPDHRLDGDRYRVVISLRAANADPVAQEYELTNGGVGGSITLTQRVG